MPKKTRPPLDENLQAFATLLKNLPTRQEFVESFANVVTRVKAFESALSRDFANLVSTINKKVDDKLATVKDGNDGAPGRDGKDSTVPGPKGERGESIVGPPGKDGSPDTADDIRNKLELLNGDERLDKKAIRGIEDIERQIAEGTNANGRFIGPSPGIQLYVGGAKKGKQQYLNFIAGTGVTISYNRANGRNDITFNATGGGGGGSLSILAATGTIDDSNTTFTFPSTPSIVIVNGASYRDGHGCTISTTTVTLDSPVGTGGDVYALG